MPSLHHLLKSVNSQPGIKSKLKGLLGKSSSFPLYSKPGTRDPFTPSWLPSSSFRSFQCEISKFSSRTWEVNESEKPFSVSEAVSRVFATPSIHGPMWQALSYHTHQCLGDNSVLNSQTSVHLAAAALQCKITGVKHSNLEAKFMCALESSPESCVFGVSVWPKLWTDPKNPVWEDMTRFATCKQVDFDSIPQIDWSWDFEKTRDSTDIEESETHTFTFQSTLTDLFSLCSELCHSALGTSLGSLMHDFGEIKPGSFLLDISPEFPVIDDTCVTSKGLRLLSGACYFPHPEKELTGGEDAYFICPEKQMFGVADGVGGWAELGVDSGEYARRLMIESLIAAREEPTGSVDAARVLKKAYSKTTCQGSSTACILALSGYGLQAVNLGDSGFIVVRNGRMIFKSPAQQHNFNFPFQLESCGAGDPVSAAELFVVDVAAEDVIIAGTDGLFDNLFATEIETIVLQAKWSGMSPDVTAQKIAYLARERANDCNGETPFSAAAQNAGYSFYGGKMDDITVIVSYVTDHPVD
ncbi:hypothetical protein L7F22_021151 [Adiantum nelumboides]|nr:hypothetical protein [Adiantum nelumboides]